MPAGRLKATAKFMRSGQNGVARVTLTNPGKTLAFFVRLQVTGSDGEEALPVFWDDNYVSLLPGETRVISARWRRSDLHGAPRLVLSGWNVKKATVR
jgi:hypothetical protein